MKYISEHIFKNLRLFIWFGGAQSFVFIVKYKKQLSWGKKFLICADEKPVTLKI